MAETTGISWCDSTWNAWQGCTKIAPACDHCYAAALDARWGGDHWGNVPRRRTSEGNWREPLKWQRTAAQFFAENGHRRRIFLGSMMDWADNQIDPAWREDMWAVIRDCPDLDWLMLTKRPQNIEKTKPDWWDEIRGRIWFGTTVEDQEHADQNIPHLLKHDSAVRFISAEPLLGPIDLTRWLQRGLNWVITGGESGPHARPSHPDWFRSLRDQCAAAGIPFHFKQWGEYVVGGADGINDPRWKLVSNPMGRSAGMRRVGKKVAGHALDGATHTEFPVAA